VAAANTVELEAQRLVSLPAKALDGFAFTVMSMEGEVDVIPAVQEVDDTLR
jgi:hypothetical protein